MSRRVKGPDGIVHIFPDDATDAEVAAALESSAPRETRIGANLHQEAKIGADPHPGGADFSVLGVPIHVPGEDKPRADENLADVGGVGIPPESVLMGPLQAGRAMLKPALSMANRATAGAGAMLTHIAPVVKYEVAKHTLERMGLPASVATVAAMGISGYRRGGKAAAPEAAAPKVAEATPVAAAPVEAPAAAPAPAFNPTSGLKAARDAFAALGETPRPAEVSNVSALIQRGKSPSEAVAIVIKNRPLTPSGSPAADFAARYGLPSEADRIAAQDLRNAQGKVKTPSAETARARKLPDTSNARTQSPYSVTIGDKTMHARQVMGFNEWKQSVERMGFESEQIDMAKKAADHFGETIQVSDDLHDFDAYMEGKYGNRYLRVVDDLIEGRALKARR